VATMLLMLVMGAFEYGMALRDWLSVTVATREGARVAASAADFDNADCVILEATAGALQSFRSGDIEYVFIYRSDANGSIPGDVTTSPPGGDALMNIYRPYFGDPDIPIPSCPFWTEHSIGGSWDPADRLNPNPFGDPYWIGVSLRYTHEWYTGFMFWNG